MTILCPVKAAGRPLFQTPFDFTFLIITTIPSDWTPDQFSSRIVRVPTKQESGTCKQHLSC